MSCLLAVQTPLILLRYTSCLQFRLLLRPPTVTREISISQRTLTDLDLPNPSSPPTFFLLMHPSRICYLYSYHP
jgi:hypothetical protein